ncbi:MAG: acetylxylan esterase [Actinomycetota bacterium]|jgi:dienelactone hydrolase|nr:acetylxylan esterase [Actinomycetota bacterium]
MRSKLTWLPVVVLATAALAGGLVAMAGAHRKPVTVSGVFAGHTMDGKAVPCVVQPDKVRLCHGDENGVGKPDERLKSFDGTPLAVYVILPATRASQENGNYPLVVQSHGWGDPPAGLNDTQFGGPTAAEWASDGYAVLQVTARGWGDSCGTPASRLVNPAACKNGYIHLDDYRYEARDIQYAIGLLVDEHLVNPNRIGVTGESYGAGVSLELATLDNREMLPNGKLVPWRSPDGTPLHIAAAAPFAGFSDLAYALMPNGRTLDYALPTATTDLSPIGVEKKSILSGLYTLGALEGSYAPSSATVDNVTSWYQTISAGEPYTTPADKSLVQQIAHYHSSLYLLDGAYGMKREAPAPLLLANGFTDTIFPVNTAVRYYNLERSLFPSDPISLFDFDGGHMRGQNKPAELALLRSRIKSFLEYYLKGSKTKPTMGATALTETCPKTAPAGGPYHASTWAGLHPGEVDYSSPAAQTVGSAPANPTISKTFDPVYGGGACASAPATPSAQGPGVAIYRLPAATGSGYTLLGAPTVTARFHVVGDDAYITERLLDVDLATGTETLITRGVYRLDAASQKGVQALQLNPGAWHFAAGHAAELEILGQDTPYTRPSNGTFTVSVSDLELRLPVHEVPGARGTPSVVHKWSVRGLPGAPGHQAHGKKS